MPITKASGQAVAPAAKGDLVVGSATNDAAVLGVGSTDQVLTVDSSTTTGLKWATPSAGGMTLISTTTLTGASIVLSSIPQTYNNLSLVVRNYRPATDSTILCMRLNAVTATEYFVDLTTTSSGATTWSLGNTYIQLGGNTTSDNGTSSALHVTNIPDYTNSTTFKFGSYQAITNDPTNPTTQFRAGNNNWYFKGTSAISSITLFPESGNFTSGTALLYGVK